MAVTATPQSQIQRIADTEAERSTSWPEGSRVFCLDGAGPILSKMVKLIKIS